MMQTAAEIAGICLIATILCRLMDKYQKEYTVILAAAVSAGIFLAATMMLSPVLDAAKNFLDQSGIRTEYTELLFKALGICYLVQFSSDICRDNGEGALASQLEFLGKVTLVLLALPLFTEVLSLVTEIMSF